MPTPIYVPVLKGKEGEFAALEVLFPEIKALISPLVEVPAIPYDYVNEKPSKSLDEHLAGLPSKLKKCVGTNAIYLDFPWTDEASELQDGLSAYQSVYERCAAEGVSVIPVFSLDTGEVGLSAAANHSAATKSGTMLRLQIGDFKEDEDIDLHSEIERIVSALSVNSRSEIDLLIDLGDIGADVSRALLVARSVLSMIPTHESWRRLILSGASFPEDLSDVSASTTAVLPRLEWDLWKALQKRPSLLPRKDIIFSDYSIAHPLPKELDPRTMRMSANIRYTTEDGWLILKGRNVRQFGFEQFFELCRELVRRPEYSGRDFSWGDRFISDCAEGQAGPGNATTWRKVGVNHHLTLITKMLASFRREV